MHPHARPDSRSFDKGGRRANSRMRGYRVNTPLYLWYAVALMPPTCCTWRGGGGAVFMDAIRWLPPFLMVVSFSPTRRTRAVSDGNIDLRGDPAVRLVIRSLTAG